MVESVSHVKTKKFAWLVVSGLQEEWRDKGGDRIVEGVAALVDSKIVKMR